MSTIYVAWEYFIGTKLPSLGAPRELATLLRPHFSSNDLHFSHRIPKMNICTFVSHRRILCHPSDT